MAWSAKDRVWLCFPLLLAMTGRASDSGFKPRKRKARGRCFPPKPSFTSSASSIRTLPEYHRFLDSLRVVASGEGWWVVDWPDADDHFSQGVERLTRIATGDPVHMRLTDDRLFDYPWIYATQTGWWNLSDAETARLREYLLRGGFLVVDDFWGADHGKFPRDHGACPARDIPFRTWPKQIR